MTPRPSQLDEDTTSNVGSRSGAGRGVPDPTEPSPEATRRRLRLVCDLADALAAQTDGIRRHPEALSQAGAAGRLVEPLADHAAKLHRVAVRLRRSLDELEGTARDVGIPVRAEGSGEPGLSPTGARKHEGHADTPSGRGGVADPARSLALELRLAGSTREQVERYLMEAFDLDNASEITELVFGRTKSAPRSGSPTGSLAGSDD